MDEILIEDKRYVSSKQAAKLTGYAKDYVGQLCREGRVPARLVGRSWYVLESAIQDHRFGDMEKEVAPKKAPEAQKESKSWDSPRYESVSADPLPTVNRLQESVPEKEEKESFPENFENSWKEWFDRFENAVLDTSPAQQEEQKIQEEVIEAPAEPQEEEVPVPIHAVYRPRTVDEAFEEKVVVSEPRTAQKGFQRLTGGLKVAGALIALISASAAVISTGYFDNYIASSERVKFISGVFLYNK